MQLARHLASICQQDAAAMASAARGNQGSSKNKFKLPVGDLVWVWFPESTPGVPDKWANHYCGSYKIHEWLQNEHRSAILHNTLFANDTIAVHMDRMVIEAAVPEHLRVGYKPFELPLAQSPFASFIAGIINNDRAKLDGDGDDDNGEDFVRDHTECDDMKHEVSAAP
jgi:hypothetical protein